MTDLVEWRPYIGEEVRVAEHIALTWPEWRDQPLFVVGLSKDRLGGQYPIDGINVTVSEEWPITSSTTGLTDHFWIGRMGKPDDLAPVVRAALEQAGEPVAGVLGDIQRFHKSYICLGGDDDGEEYVRWSDVLAALPTLQRLGQEFDAGEGLARRVAETMDEDGGCWSACSGCQEGVDGCVSARDYPYSPIFKCQPGSGCRECGSNALSWFAHNRNRSQVVEGRLKTSDVECLFVLGCDACSETLRTVSADEIAAQLTDALATPSQPDPQCREQAFDGEGEVLKKAAEIAGDVFWNLPMPSHWDRDKEEYVRWCSRQSKFVREQIAALSSAKRGEEG